MNRPLHCVTHLAVLQRPHILRQCCAVSVLLASHRLLVDVKPRCLNDMALSKSSVLFLYIIIGLHRCFVHNGSCLALPPQVPSSWQLSFSLQLQRTASADRGFQSLLSIAEDHVVVPFDNCSHVWHTTVAQLQGVPVEYFVQLRVLGEVLAYQRPKPSADVRGYIAAVGWVEPSDVPLTVPPCLSSLLSTCHVFKLLIIAASLKHIIVQRTSIGAGKFQRHWREISLSRLLMDEGRFLMITGGWLDCLCTNSGRSFGFRYGRNFQWTGLG